jgi:hypothetical protein
MQGYTIKYKDNYGSQDTAKLASVNRIKSRRVAAVVVMINSI